MAWVKIGTGTINKSKDDSRGAPYYGKCKLEIDGQEHEISIGCWVKTGNNNSKFFSLQFSVQDDQQQATRKQPATKRDENDEVPF